MSRTVVTVGDGGSTVVTQTVTRNTVVGIQGPPGPAGFGGGPTAPDIVLKDWTASEAYEPTTITRDAEGVMTSAVIVWPDGSPGTLTRTERNETWLAVDAYEATHEQSGKTIRQAKVTRNAEGAITTKPALVVEATA